MFSLTTTHLRFVCEATTPLNLEIENFRAGQNLRGALGQVMTRTYCPHPQPLSSQERGGGERSHAAVCPVHWLLAANEKPGQERRGYTIVPPCPHPNPPTPLCFGGYSLPSEKSISTGEGAYLPGERFEFGITLFGNTLKFLPYFVLAVPELGRMGVGPGRGKFSLKSVWAENPLTRERECLLAEGENLVHTPTLTMTHAEVERIANYQLPMTNSNLQHPTSNVQFTIDFLTPTRLIEEGDLAKAPAFDVLFARLLGRLDDLAQQFCSGERRGGEAALTLQRVAEQVRLVESQTRWVEVWSGSQRSNTPSPLSGIVGRATYAALSDVWEPLSPWLLWGQLAQVGKSTVKGNGVIQVRGMKDANLISP